MISESVRNRILSLLSEGKSVTEASTACNVSYKTVYNWVKKEERFAEAKEEGEERFLDVAEGKLKEMIKAGDLTATIFYLKTKGKNRGYTERTELQAEVNNAKREELEEMARKFFAQE